MRGLILAALLVPVPALAGEAGAFLDAGVGARIMALGGAGTATADDATALYWNPAGLASLEDGAGSASFSHAELAVGQRHDYLGAARAVEGLGAAGLALTYQSYGDLEGRDSTGRRTADFGASDAVLALGFARKEDEGQAGMTVKLIRSHIAEAEATTTAVDLGVMKSAEAGGGKTRAGLALRNLGPGLKYENKREPLPFSTNLGLAWSRGPVTLAVDYRYFARRGGHEAGGGVEFQPVRGFSGRVGYMTQAPGGGEGVNAVKGLTMGAGFDMGRARVDYAAVPGGELGLTHRVDLGVRF